MRGEQRLVRGDHRSAAGERRKDERARGLDAAHELDDDVRAGDERLAVRGQQRGVNALARDRDVAHVDADDLERRANAGREIVCMFGEEAHHLRADRARAQEWRRRWAAWEARTRHQL